MTKKEFKKKCKKEKTTSYKLMLSGGVVSVLALIIILITFVSVDDFSRQLVGFVLGGIIAIIGMALDLAGEMIVSKQYKEYNKKVIGDD